jgi:hypothetical protein
MRVGEPDAFKLARHFAPEAEEILGVTGIVKELNAFSEERSAKNAAQSRSISLGDIGSIASALISLFMWIDQIRKGNVLKGASRAELIHDLCIRVLDSDALSQAAKERLISRALDRIPARSE